MSCWCNMGTGQFEFEGTSKCAAVAGIHPWYMFTKGGGSEGSSATLVASVGGRGMIKPPVTHSKSGDPRPCSLWQLGPEKLPICRGIVMSRIRGV